MRGVERKERAGWEQARYIAYYCMRPWAGEGFSMEDMVHFPWEKETDEETPLTEAEEREEEKRILTKMAIIEQQLKKRNGKQ